MRPSIFRTFSKEIIMKKPLFIKRFRQLSNEELALFLMSISFFLPFYLFLTIFILYLVLLAVLKKLHPIITDLIKHPAFLAFFLYSLVISFIAQNWPGFIATWFFLLFFIFFQYYQQVITPTLFRLILQSIVVLSLIAVSVAFLEHNELISKFDYSFISPFIQRVHQNRSEVTFFNPNYYGIICCFFIMICIYYLFTTSDLRWKFICFIAAILNGFALNYTQSRTSFLAILFGVLVYFFMTIKNAKAVLLSIITMIFFIYLLFSSDLGMRMSSLDFAFQDRMQIWEDSLKLIRMNTWIGEGPLTYMHAYERVGGAVHEHAHSLYIDTLLSYGAVGIALLSVCVARPVRQMIHLISIQKLRAVLGLIISFVVVVFVNGIFDLAIFWIQSGFLFLLVFCTLPMWVEESKDPNNLTKHF